MEGEGLPPLAFVTDPGLMHFHQTRSFSRLTYSSGAQPRWLAATRGRLEWMNERLPLARHRLVLCLAAVVSIAASLASSHALRHSLVLALANICIVGGVVAAPLVTVIAWIGMVLPEQSLLHHAANALFAVAFVWLCLAIVGAHARSNERHA